VDGVCSVLVKTHLCGDEHMHLGSGERELQCLCEFTCCVYSVQCVCVSVCLTFEQQRCEGDERGPEAAHQVSVRLVVPGWILKNNNVFTKCAFINEPVATYGLGSITFWRSKDLFYNC
jgi:hypothetical protein